MAVDDRPRVVGDLDERGLLELVLPRAGTGRGVPGVVVPAGDDAAVLVGSEPLVATTDTLVRGSDWRDDWSTGDDVGHKAIAQNAADVAAMGGRCAGFLLTLAADPDTSLDWVLALADGIGQGAARAGAPVVGGDLSSAPAGVLIVSVTALGALDGPAVTRAGARPGHRLALAGTLGRSAAGLELLVGGVLAADERSVAAECLALHRRPTPPLAAGPAAAAAGASAMIDLSDGLARDAHRVARASGVTLVLDPAAVAVHADHVAQAVGRSAARRCVLTGGEEHSLLAAFPPDAQIPPPFAVVGEVVAGHGVRLGDVDLPDAGWDHFAP